MKQENEIVGLVYAAQSDRDRADALLRKYLSFIKSETAKFLKRPPLEGVDDELSVAMFAFHEAVLGYNRMPILRYRQSESGLYILQCLILQNSA